MGFVNFMNFIFKPCELFLSEDINIARNLQKDKFIGGLPIIKYHRFMYKAPFSGHSLLTLNLSFKVIPMRFEVVLD